MGGEKVKVCELEGGREARRDKPTVITMLSVFPPQSPPVSNSSSLTGVQLL